METIEVFLITVFITKKDNTNFVCSKLDRNTTKGQIKPKVVQEREECFQICRPRALQGASTADLQED